MASPSALARFTSMRAISAARPLSSRAYAKVVPQLQGIRNIFRFCLDFSVIPGPFSRSIQSTPAMPPDAVRTVQVVSYLAGAVAALTAVWVYKSNSRRERARWAESLYSRFYEREELKRVRDLLDCDVGDPQVSQLVTAESSVWTDYLNFFE